MKKFLALVVFVIFVVSTLSCGLGGFKIYTGDLGEAYRNQAAMNPEKICTPYMLEKVWRNIKERSYYNIDRNRLYDSADKVLLKISGKKFINNPYDYDIFGIWSKIDKVARITGKSRSDLCYAVINGMIQDLKKQDKWASFFDAEEGQKRFGSMIGEDYYGIGFLMMSDYKAKRLFVKYVYKGHAAARGGLKKFDEILAIDGKAVKKMNHKKIVFKFRGKKDTKIHLLIKRKAKNPNKFVFRSLSFIRELVPYNDARCKMIKNIAYCKVYGFTKNTVKNFTKGFKDLPGDSNKVIVDFRDNPGGLLYSATHMLNRFWIKGKTLTILVKKKHGFVPFGDDTYKEQIFDGKKIVALVNKVSASSTELVLAALKDYSGAILIGETSFGKGVAQRVHFILGAVLSYTNMYFLSPHGNIIDKNGVSPDIKVKMTLENFINNNDTQLNAAIKLLRNK